MDRLMAGCRWPTKEHMRSWYSQASRLLNNGDNGLLPGVEKSCGRSVKHCRQYKEPLGKLVSYEMGKSLQEGYGEVQEMIDICDFAVGLSRQLHGLTMHSERPGHRMYEQWHPLGIVGIISAFNFPVAVWSWNAMLAWVCGDVCIWKPSEKTPLCAVACQHIVAEVFQRIMSRRRIWLVIGGREVGEWYAADTPDPLVSATGSTRMGKAVGAAVGARLGRAYWNWAATMPSSFQKDADLDIAILGCVIWRSRHSRAALHHHPQANHS